MSKQEKTTKDNSKNDLPSFLVPKKNLRFFLVNFGISTVVAAIIWPLLDLLFCFFDGSTFAYSPVEHILKPAEFMLFFTIIEFLTWDIWFKDGKKSAKKK